jgi:hypothetical protein
VKGWKLGGGVLSEVSPKFYFILTLILAFIFVDNNLVENVFSARVWVVCHICGIRYIVSAFALG